MSMSGHSGGSTMKLYRYDEFNRLIKYNDDGTEAKYTYGVDNLRATKTVNGTTTSYVWNGQNLASETKNDTATVYTHDPMGVLSAKTDNEAVVKYIKDPHGNVVATSKNSTLFGTYDYTAFGNQLEATDTTNPFRYCGEYYDNESGLIYLRNRYYDSTSGRFITEDPIKDGLNWYVYCNNNPVMMIDPSGLEYIVVSGSEKDGRYKYNFIETAIKNIRDLRAENSEPWITWIISGTGYSYEDLNHFNDIAYDIGGVGIQIIYHASQLQNYINSQNIGIWELSDSRKNDPVEKLVFFSHGVRGAVELGYEQANESDLTVNKHIVDGMFSEAFNSPNIWFHSCNAATGGDSSIAKSFYDVAGGFVGGYVGRTTYEYIMYPQNYSRINKHLGNQSMINIDNSIKSRRAYMGFCKTGSDYYPIPSYGSYLVTYGG